MKISWINAEKEIESQIENWIKDNLPKYMTDFSNNLYDYEEIIKYKQPKNDTNKSVSISKLKKYTREEISNMIDTRLNYLMNKVKVLETHFVSGTGGLSGRTQATPRKDEFNIISIDIFLRFAEHKFLFANPNNLDSSSADANHLQQNYIMGFVFKDNELSISEEWQEDFNEVVETINESDAICEEEMQIDYRNIIYDNGE